MFQYFFSPLLFIMHIPLRIIALTRQHQAHRARSEATQFTPHTRGNRDALLGTVQLHYHAAFTVAQLYFHAARHREHHLVTRPMCMTTTLLPDGNIRDPKHASHLKGDLSTPLSERQAPSDILAFWQLYPRHSTWQNTFFFHFSSDFGAKIYFFFQISCTIRKKHLPLHRKTEEESSSATKNDRFLHKKKLRKFG